MDFAKQLEKLGTETAFAVAAMAAEHRAGGGRVFPFHLGDINIPPPDSMTQGVARAIADGKNGYCPGAGIPVFREQLARVVSQTRGVESAAENIAAQPGGKPVIAKFLQLTMNPGDEVLYPVPGFPIYESQIRYQGGVPVPYHYRPSADGGGFELDLDELRNAVSAKTRALIFNNHHNPTGASASDAELDAVGRNCGPARLAGYGGRGVFHHPPRRGRGADDCFASGHAGADGDFVHLLQAVCDDRLAAGRGDWAGGCN